jgi:hypothetical protein
MLAPLGVYLLTMLIACTLALLICWACDAHTAEIDNLRSLPVVLKFTVYSRRRSPHFRRPAPRLLELPQRRVEGRPRPRRWHRHTSGLCDLPIADL